MRPDKPFNPKNVVSVPYNNTELLFDTSWHDFTPPVIVHKHAFGFLYAVDGSGRLWITQDYDEETIRIFSGEHDRYHYLKKRQQWPIIYKDIFISPDQRFCNAVINQK